jgi:hypothetical protein
MAAKQKVARQQTLPAKKKAAAKRKVRARTKGASRKKVSAKKKVAAKRPVARRGDTAKKATVAATLKRAAKTSRAGALTLTAGESQLAPTDMVPIPLRSTFNRDLSSASEATMLQLLGVPGAKTQNCSRATGTFRQRVVTSNVGPFKATGLDVAIGSLKAVFDDAKAQIPAVVAAVKNDGMLCVRHKRKDPGSFSNHSWGTAIDLFYGAAATPQGSPKTQRGNLLLAPFFNKHGWFWGAGFSGASVDSMHFELAEETVRASLRSVTDEAS